MNRTIQRCAITLALVALLSFGAAAKINIVHMAFAGHGAPYREFLEEMAEKFSELYPGITVDIIPGGVGGLHTDQVVTMLAAGVGPDVTDFSETNMGPLVDQGIFLDLAPYFAQDRHISYDDFIPTAFQAVTAPDGTVIGFPTDVYPIVAFYNRDILDQAGLNTPNDMPPEYWTWEHFLDSAQKTTVQTADGDPIQFGLGQPTSRWWNYIVQAGGTLYDRSLLGSVSHWNTPQVLEGLEWLNSLMYEHEVAPFYGMPNGNRFDFNNGQTAFSLSWGPGMVGAFLQDVSFNWDIALQPLGPGNRGSQVAINSMQVLAQTDHPDEVWEWLKFVAHNEQSVERYIQLTGRMPALLSVQADFPHLAGRLAPTNWLRYYETALDPDSFTTFVPRMYSDVMRVVDASLQQTWRGQQSPRAAVEQIHARVTAILETAAP